MAQFSKASYEQEATKQGYDSIFKLQLGKNPVRIVSMPETFGQHYMQREQRTMICMNSKTCDLCRQNIKRDARIMLYVIDRKDQQIKLAIFPWKIYKDLINLAEDTDWGFKDLPEYDITIVKEGEKMLTKYSTIPSPNKTSLTKEQKDQLATKKPIIEILKAKVAKQKSDFVPMNEKGDVKPLEEFDVEDPSDVSDTKFPWDKK